MSRNEKKKDNAWMGVVVLIAIIYTFCAYSTPLNYFSGSPFFFSVAKAMYSGKVLYKDILEQKGILIYLMYIPGYIISHSNYIGIWLIHGIIVLFNSILMYKISAVYVESRSFCYLNVIIYSIIVYATISQSVVEFDLLPCFLLSIYLLINPDKRYSTGFFFANGIMAGIVFWVKFSMLGFYLGYMGYICLAMLIKGYFVKAVKRGTIFGLGMIAVSIPCLSYFIINDALSELIQYYFLNNIVSYGYNDTSTIKSIVINYVIDVPIWEMRMNPILFPILIFSIISLLFGFNKQLAQTKYALIVAVCVQYITVFLHGAMFDYYLYSFVAFGIFGTIVMIRFVEWIIDALKLSSVKVSSLIIIIATTTLIITTLPTKIEESMNYKNTAQFIFGQYMKKSGKELTLLDYGILDSGVFTTSGAIPSTWAYCRLNWDNQKMLQDQYDSIEEARTNFVVTKNDVKVADSMNNNYTLVLQYDDMLLYEKR